MPTSERSITLACPAKINLTLAVLGPRGDGFHELHSLVVQTAFGDELTLRHDPQDGGSDRIVIEGEGPPGDESTVADAIRLFREAAGPVPGAFYARLMKRIPVGAGLGGGSSDGATTLKAIRKLFPAEASRLDWLRLAAGIGSDCPLFLSDAPVLMEGRGERITELDPELAARLGGLEVVLFKPRFSINTAEAYSRMAARKVYCSQPDLGRVLEEWSASGEPLPAPLNDFERLLDIWIPSLPIVLKRLREQHGLDARLSGSGSACFAFTPGSASVMEIVQEEMRRAWGECDWVAQTHLK